MGKKFALIHTEIIALLFLPSRLLACFSGFSLLPFAGFFALLA